MAVSPQASVLRVGSRLRNYWTTVACPGARAKTHTDDTDPAVNILWLVLLKLANLEDGRKEDVRMFALVGRLPEDAIRAIVNGDAVDSLLTLDPPLETVVGHPREELETARVTAALEKVRKFRSSAPREAMSGLGVVLKAVRNKREHGFKTPLGPRDSDILRPARHLLDQLCRAALQARSMSSGSPV
jgi:hypothetical protein